MASRIEQIIEEIEEYIAGCKHQRLSSSNIIVNKDEIEELLTELRLKTPDEIKRYQKIISNQEAILANAQAKADAIISEANMQTTQLVSEHQIMQQAYAQANEIVYIANNNAQELLDSATEDANNIRLAAIAYTDDMLKNLQDIIDHSIQTSRAKYDNLLEGLENCNEIVKVNRSQLAPQYEEDEEEQAEEEDIEDNMDLPEE